MVSDVKKPFFFWSAVFLLVFFVLFKSLDFPTPEEGVLLLAYGNVRF